MTLQNTQPKKVGRHIGKIERFHRQDRILINQARNIYMGAWQSKDQAKFVEAENNLRKVFQDAKSRLRQHKDLHT